MAETLRKDSLQASFFFWLFKKVFVFVSYLQTVHDAVISQLFPGIIDLGRVFFCGYDSGGMLAWPVACAFGRVLSFYFFLSPDSHYISLKVGHFFPPSALTMGAWKMLH